MFYYTVGRYGIFYLFAKINNDIYRLQVY